MNLNDGGIAAFGGTAGVLMPVCIFIAKYR